MNANKIIVDTSAWIYLFKKGDEELQAINNDFEIVMHEMILTELLLGGLPGGISTYEKFKNIIMIPTVSLPDLDKFIVDNTLFSRGVGFVDINIIASALFFNADIYSRDKKLMRLYHELRGIKKS